MRLQASRIYIYIYTFRSLSYAQLVREIAETSYHSWIEPLSMDHCQQRRSLSFFSLPFVFSFVSLARFRFNDGAIVFIVIFSNLYRGLQLHEFFSSLRFLRTRNKNSRLSNTTSLLSSPPPVPFTRDKKDPRYLNRISLKAF